MSDVSGVPYSGQKLAPSSITIEPVGDLGNQPPPKTSVATPPTPAQIDEETAPAPSLFDDPRVQNMVKARAAGYSWKDIQDFTAKNNPSKVPGINDPTFDAMVDVHAGIAATNATPNDTQDGLFTTLVKSFGLGLQEGSLGQATSAAGEAAGYTMPPLQPQDIGLVGRVAEALGVQADAIPAIMAGAGVGTFAGPVGTALGALGGFALNEYVRSTIADMREGNIAADPKEAAVQMAVRAYNSIKDTLPMGAAAAVGPMVAAGGVLAVTAAEIAAVTGAASFLAGKLPSWEELIDNSILVGLFHTKDLAKAGIPEVQKAYKALNSHWAATGQEPGKALATMQNGALGPAIPPTGAAGPPKPLSVPTPRPADDLEGQLRNLSNSQRAIILEMQKRLDALPPEIREAPADGGFKTLDQKFYHHIERPDEVPLTEREQAIFDEHVAPLKGLELDLAKGADKYSNPFQQARNWLGNFMHRIGIGAKTEPTEGEGNPAIPFTRGLSLWAASKMSIKYHTLVARDGTRHVVSDYPGGRGVYFWHSGEKVRNVTPEGNDPFQFPGTPVKIVDGKVVEEQTTPARTPVEKPINPEVVGGKLTEGQYRASGERQSEKTIPGKEVPPKAEEIPRLRVGGYFKTVDNSVYRVERPTTKELTDHTKADFQESAIANTMANIVQLDGVIRRGQLADNLKKNLEAMELGVEDTSFAAKKEHPGWRTVDVSWLDGWLVHPDIANKIDDYVKGGPRFSTPGGFFDRLAKGLVGTMFSTGIGNIMHAENVSEMALVGRGFDNLKGLPGAGRAWDAVQNQTDDYIEALRNDLPVMSDAIGADFVKSLMENVGLGVTKNPSVFDPIAEKMGLENAEELGHVMKTGMAKELYRFGDYLVMQRYFELLDEGKSKAEAVESIRKSYAVYNTSSKIAGQRWLAKILFDPALVWFGRYAVSKYGSLLNIVKDTGTAIKTLDPELARDVAGRAAVVVFLLGVSEAIKDKTGWNVGFGGNFTIVRNLTDLAKYRSQAAFQKVLNGILTVSPVLQEGYSQLRNQDVLSGKPLGDPIDRFVHAAKSLLGPVNEGSSLASEGLGGFVGSTLRVTPPNPTSDFFQKGGKTRQQILDERKAKTKDTALKGITREVLQLLFQTF